MGTLWRQSGLIARDDNDIRAPGALAFFYSGGTDTPLTTYTTAAMNVANTHPVVADGDGRWPTVFLPYETYRERVTNPWLVTNVTPGTTLSDVDNILNPEPPSSSTSTDTSFQLKTGDIFSNLSTAQRDGCVRLNGATIGSATSGASERENADTLDLYVFFYVHLSDAICPVSGGRSGAGAGFAAADFAANKTLTLPDWRGVGPVGLDDMGTTAASRFTGVSFLTGNATTIGSTAGENTHTITIAEMPVHTPAGTIAQITPAGTIAQITPAGTINTPTITVTNGTNILQLGGGGAANVTHGGGGDSTVTVTATSSALTFTGTAFTPVFTGTAFTPVFTGTSVGSGNTHNNMQRSALVTWHCKL